LEDEPDKKVTPCFTFSSLKFFCGEELATHMHMKAFPYIKLEANLRKFLLQNRQGISFCLGQPQACAFAR
jgi:hypothetical protein